MNIIRRLNKHLRRKPRRQGGRGCHGWASRPMTCHGPRRSPSARRPAAGGPSAASRRLTVSIACAATIRWTRSRRSVPEANSARISTSVMPVVDPTDFGARAERLNELAAIRRAHASAPAGALEIGGFRPPLRALSGRWRGAFGTAQDLCGGPKTGVDKPAHPAYRPRRRPRNPGPSCLSGAGD